MTNEDELRDYLELVAANLRRTRGCLREAEEEYAGPVAIVGMGACALTTWRRRDRGGPAAADWRYRVTWTPGTGSASGALPGTWLLVAPQRRQFRDMVAHCAGAMASRGARVDTLLVDCASVSWDVLAGLLVGAVAGEPLAGVVSFLGLGEAPAPDGPADPDRTLTLVQALSDAGISAPLWVLARDAAAQPEPAAPGGVPAGVPPEFGPRAAALLCTVLAGWDADRTVTRPAGVRGARRERAAWSAEADRERLQAVNEAAGAPAQ
jgi:hypothetical protein